MTLSQLLKRYWEKGGLPGIPGVQPPKDRMRRLRTLERQLGYTFRFPVLLDRALTHKSFADMDDAGTGDYEKLEFLGDALLDHYLSEYLFLRHPDRSEGWLTRTRAFLVSSRQLCCVSKALCLGEFLNLSPGEEKTGGRQKQTILADAFESVLAAVYLDGGEASARHLVLQCFSGLLEEVALADHRFKDDKTRLQEALHAAGKTTPHYQVIEEHGPDHQKEFVIEVSVEGQVLSSGAGKSKKEAQQRAASQALEELGRLDPNSAET